MSVEDAERIINIYGGIIAGKNKGDIVQDVKVLPCSQGKIMHAIFTYTEFLINEDLFTEEIKNNLNGVYGLLSCQFLEENVDKINSAWRSYKTSEKAREYLDQHGGITFFFPAVSKMNEYHNFVADCYGNWNKGA